MDDAVGSNTSVYVSGFNHDYLGILNSDPETTVKYKPTGTTNAILSNRVSWFFDFKGPSMTIDTACSSSLVALHLAVQSLRARETNMVCPISHSSGRLNGLISLSRLWSVV